MGENEAIQVEIKHLQEGQKKIERSLVRLESKVEDMDKHFSVELAKLDQAAKTKGALYGGIVSIAGLLLTITINFFV